MLVTAVAAALTAGGYVTYAVVRHFRSITLPAPTGRYAVGRTTFTWTDPRRTDPLAPHRGVARKLSVWLWYPAASQQKRRSGGYAPDGWAGLHFPDPAGLGETSFGKVRTHALVDAAVAPGRFPIVVLEPGLGLAAVQYTVLAEDLASHGYLVAGVTPTYSANLTVLDGHPVHGTRAGNPPHFSPADGNRLVTTWAADDRFAAAQVTALNGRFAGHVIAGRTAYVGHSFGGAAAIQACADDKDCAGAVDLDGTPYGPVVHRGLAAPLMIIGSAGSCTTGSCRPHGATDRQTRAAARSLLAASSGPRWCYSITGTKHFNFTDYAAYYLAAPLRWLVPLGSINGDRGLADTGTYVVAFLHHAFRRTTGPLLTRPSRDVRTLRSAF